ALWTGERVVGPPPWALDEAVRRSSRFGLGKSAGSVPRRGPRPRRLPASGQAIWRVVVDRRSAARRRALRLPPVHLAVCVHGEHAPAPEFTGAGAGPAARAA